jgi:large subunit ribosomal protein L1
MPTSLPYGAPVDSIATRFKSSIRVRAKNQLNVSDKIGDEKMDDKQLAENAGLIIAAIEKKLPQGDKNIINAMVNFTMSKPAKLTALNTKEDKE